MLGRGGELGGFGVPGRLRLSLRERERGAKRSWVTQGAQPAENWYQRGGHLSFFSHSEPCPYCGKMNPAPEDTAGRTERCQWCNREYAYSLTGLPEATERATAAAPVVSGDVACAPSAGLGALSCASCGAAIILGAKFCAVCGMSVPEPDAATELISIRSEIRALRHELEDLRRGAPKTGLLSDDFWTRALAVFGHNMAVGAILYLVVLVFLFIVVRR